MIASPTDLPRPFRAWLASVLLAISTAAVAQGATLDTPDAQALDLDLQALKAETLALTRELRDAEHGYLYPNGSRTRMFVSVKVPGFMLDGISVRINDKDRTAHRYSNAESRALLRKGWHALHVEALEPGTYRLQADFQGHFANARGTDPAIRGRLETLFEKKAGADLDLVLPISRNTRLEKPSMSEIGRRESRLTSPGRNVWLPEPEALGEPDANRPVGGEDDARFRSAIYHRIGNRYVAALNDLLDIRADAGDPAALPAEYYRLLADCYLGFGMHLAAEEAYDRLAANPNGRESQVAQGQLELANYEYQRGHFSQAEVRLYRLKGKLPEDLHADWRMLMTYVLMAQAKYADVAKLLIPAGGNIDDAEDLPAVLQYNLAVALMKGDAGLEGRRLMNRVGQMEVEDVESLSLRDKANLSLGYQYLQLQNGKNAKALFGRIRATGPFSGNALLGLGWAEIATGSAPPEPAEKEPEGIFGAIASALGFGDDEKVKKKKAEFNIKGKGPSGMSPREAESIQLALTPWAELIERDPMDSAVQEAMLAIPWALQKLEAYEDALKYYQSAIDTLEVARRRMAQAQKSIESGVMVYTMIKDDLDSERGWRWRLSNLADTPETYYMQSLLAEHRFMETLKNHRDARLLGRSLESWKERLEAMEKAWRETQRPVAAAPTPEPGDAVTVESTANLQARAPGDYPVEASASNALTVAAAAPAPELPPSPVRALHLRLEALAPKVARSKVAHNALLEAISLKELAGQQETIEKYLTEARFSVARIFDVQSRGQ